MPEALKVTTGPERDLVDNKTTDSFMKRGPLCASMFFFVMSGYNLWELHAFKSLVLYQLTSKILLFYIAPNHGNLRFCVSRYSFIPDTKRLFMWISKSERGGQHNSRQFWHFEDVSFVKIFQWIWEVWEHMLVCQVIQYISIRRHIL